MPEPLCSLTSFHSHFAALLLNKSRSIQTFQCQFPEIPQGVVQWQLHAQFLLQLISFL